MKAGIITVVGMSSEVFGRGCFAMERNRARSFSRVYFTMNPRSGTIAFPSASPCVMLPAIIGLSATQINLFINTFFASSCPEGSVSWLNYAFRLIMFPIGVVGVSLSIATLPVVSVHASRGDTAQLRDAYVSSTVLSFLLTIPASAGLIFLATPIVSLIFEHGRFTPFDTMNTAQAPALYSPGLFAYASLKIIVPVFYALNKPRFPVIGSFITVCFNFIFVIRRNNVNNSIYMTRTIFQHSCITT